MVFRWFRNRRRLRLLGRPFPRKWFEPLRRALPAYEAFPEREQVQLQDLLRLFVWEKHWEGCGGLELTEEMKVTIGSLACLLILGLDYTYYDHVLSVLVYPEPFVAEGKGDVTGSEICHSPSQLLGMAQYRGPVILSWSSICDDLRRRGGGGNLVVHEFAHKLDMLDERIDGTPPLETPEHYNRWRAVMSEEYRRLSRALKRGRVTLLDTYGCSSEGEFFAVATECFFVQPAEMGKRHPELYEVLKSFYRQDPAKRGLTTRSDG